MLNSVKVRLLVWQILLALGIVVAVLISHETTTAVPNTPEANPAWGSATLITGAGQDARRPRIASSPDASHLLVVYINENDDDPYYTMSTNQGQSWSPATGTKLQATAGTSAQVIGVIDQNNKAYAIWVEKNTALGYELVYSSKAGANNWLAPVRIADSAEILDPSVFLDHRNNLHLVWVQQGVVYYSFMVNGGLSWSTPISVEETPLGFSGEPAAAVDRNGRLYLVWQNDTITGGQEVVFSRGTITGTPAAPVWNPDFENELLSPIDMPIAAHAVMATSGSQLHVAYTRKIDVPDPGFDKQDIFYATCFFPCEDLSGDNFVTISGALVEVAGILPSEAIAALAYDNLRNSAYMYFNGIDANISLNEVILGVNSCDNWGNTLERDFVEGAGSISTYRFVKPSLTINGNWIQVVYERFEGTNPHLIFHQRAEVTCEAKSYLPLLLRN